MAKNSYSAGDLNISIQTIADDTLAKLDAVVERLTFINTQLGGITSKARRTKRGRNPLTFAKMGFKIYSMRRLGRFMANLVQAGSDYYETLNLWQVAMRNNLDVADQFINKMNKAYGISTQTLMNAQAIFKNMLGSLGQISDQTAYAISEALVQMSADFSSLYNVKLEDAFQKMQAMLAGQVRPIRSAGLDITETTLFMYYQQLGGTKTMRQLNRTEKQLLSILAVYNQMGGAGALGDMTKTLNSFANQSRMLTEYWKELKAWSGLILKDLIEEWQILEYVNAALITVTEIIKAVAKSRGLGKDNFIDGMFESVDIANNSVDELKGKLLDFDKFRSIQGAEDNVLGIDEKLLEAIAGYSSQIDQAQNAAPKLAKTWLGNLGFITDSNNQLKISKENLDTLVNLFDAVMITIGIILSYKFIPWLFDLAKGAKVSAIAMHLLNYAIIGGAVFAILQAVDAFKRGHYWAGALASVIGVSLATAFIILNKKSIAATIVSLKNFWWNMVVANITTDSLGVAIWRLSLRLVAFSATIIGVFLLLSKWGDMNTAQRIVGVCGVIATAILSVAMAMGAFKSALTLGLASAGIAAGIAAIAGSIATVKKEMDIPVQMAAVGASNIDSGTLFVAGEMGRTEAVYTGSNGKTNVANVKQMEQAFYNALARHSAEGNDKIVVQAYLDGEKVYENITAKAKARGKVWAKV